MGVLMSDCRNREYVRRTALELRLPSRDLVGVNIELFRQLRNGPLALDRCQRHLRLEGRRMVPS
jgi:hypothetical protein